MAASMRRENGDGTGPAILRRAGGIARVSARCCVGGAHLTGAVVEGQGGEAETCGMECVFAVRPRLAAAGGTRTSFSFSPALARSRPVACSPPARLSPQAQGEGRSPVGRMPCCWNGRQNPHNAHNGHGYMTLERRECCCRQTTPLQARLTWEGAARRPAPTPASFKTGALT